jgi:NTE family protein
MTKRALVMSGGGAKGAFELGAVDYLVNDANLDFDVIAGVSAGALHAAMLAQGKGLPGLKDQVQELKNQWFAIKGPRDNFRTRFLGKVLAFIFTKSIYDPAPVRKKLAQYVSDQRLASSGKQFRIGVVSLESGDYVPVDQRRPGAASWTLASGSIPLAFPPVIAGDESFVDGGVRNITPFQDAFRALKDNSKADDELEMYFVLASPLGPMASKAGTNWRHGRQIALRAVDILTDQIYREDVRYALDVNDGVRAYKQLGQQLSGNHPLRAALDTLPFRPPHHRDVKLWGIVPEREYMDTLDFDQVKIHQAFDAGRKAAANPLNETELRKLLG